MSQDGWSPVSREQSGIDLAECPFCRGGETTLMTNEKVPHLVRIIHFPDRGVVCPARFDQYADSMAQAAGWWNDRTPKDWIRV